MDNDEISALSLPPDFAMYQEVEKVTLKHQQELRDTKMRYGMLN